MKSKNYKKTEEWKKAHSERMKGKYIGENNPNWKGGKHTTKDGYVFIFLPTHPNSNSDGYVWEHHLVMEQNLGRYLTPEEGVHHENEIRNDNRIENLQLFSSRADHLKLHRMSEIRKFIVENKELFCNECFTKVLKRL